MTQAAGFKNIYGYRHSLKCMTFGIKLVKYSYFHHGVQIYLLLCQYPNNAPVLQKENNTADAAPTPVLSIGYLSTVIIMDFDEK